MNKKKKLMQIFCIYGIIIISLIVGFIQAIYTYEFDCKNFLWIPPLIALPILTEIIFVYGMLEEKDTEFTKEIKIYSIFGSIFAIFAGNLCALILYMPIYFIKKYYKEINIWIGNNLLYLCIFLISILIIIFWFWINKKLAEKIIKIK